VPSLSAEEKLQSAKTALNNVESKLRALIELHENIRILCFSDLIVGQLGESFATNAFIRCQKSLVAAEVIGLCALWDQPKGSNPTELTLPAARMWVDDPQVISLIQSEFAPLESQINVQLWCGQDAFSGLLARVDRLHNSPLLTTMRNHRHKYLAHNLSETRIERTYAAPLDPPTYRNIWQLLYLTIALAERLTANVSGHSFAYDVQCANSRRCAEALWRGVKVSPLE
jgi:hypothetical protein